MRSRIYLDYNASAPLRPAARDAVIAALGAPGNASSVHTEGRAARAIIEDGRRTFARLLGTTPKAIVFTSGATEAANFVLTPGLSDGGPPFSKLIVSAGEHACVLGGNRFPAGEVLALPLGRDGLIVLDDLARLLDQAGGRCLVALQAANNETGVVQPVAEAAALVRSKGGAVVCDAVQVMGRMACDFKALGVDGLILSGHKIGGPKGVGLVAFADGRWHVADRLVRGGGQEGGARGGTENPAGIAGFAAAATACIDDLAAEATRLGALRDAMELRLRSGLADLNVFGAGAPRLPNTSAFALSDVSADTLLIALDLAGCAVSSGSACSSGKVAPSHVLSAMGVDATLARGAIRASLGWATTDGDVDRFCELFQKTVRTVRARRASTPAQNPEPAVLETARARRV